MNRSIPQDRLGQDLNLYAVDLTAHPKYFKTLTDEICWTPDVKYHHQRKRRDVLFESLEQPKAKTLLPELDQWAKGHGYPGISDLITLFFRTLEEFCEANYACQSTVSVLVQPFDTSPDRVRNASTRIFIHLMQLEFRIHL